MKKENTTPKASIKHFGKEYTYQGTFTDAADYKKISDRWEDIGHSVIRKGEADLYASQAKTRTW
jgi:hypothetical protein